MARYRKIDTRMWGDSRFRELSSPGPSAKYLWMFLLTGPQTNNIPGLFRAGEMALAEELGWSIEGFREVFAETSAKGLVKADWNARVAWIPNAVKYNPPANPNVVKSWCTAWDEIPECALKAEAYQRLKAFTKGLGEAFAKAFTEGCAKGSANQEQEQEQDSGAGGAEQKLPERPTTNQPTWRTEETPHDLHPLSYASRTLQDLGLPETRANLETVAASITALTHDGPSGPGKSLPAAYEFLLGKARDALTEGVELNKFWFEDSKWRSSNERKNENRAERRQTRNLAARDAARAAVMGN